VFDNDVYLLISVLINDVISNTEIMFVCRLMVMCRCNGNSEERKLLELVDK
jgi:hypothetical protein